MRWPWDWDRLTEEVKTDPTLATLKWNDGETLISLAAHDNQLSLAKLLVENGADINAQSRNGTPLYCAVWGGNPEIVKLLLENGAPASGRSEHDETPLHLASRKGYEDIVSLLLNKGADVNAVNDDGLTPLDEAAGMRFSRIMKALLSRNAMGQVGERGTI
jgi:ankyrin repeat protein